MWYCNDFDHMSGELVNAIVENSMSDKVDSTRPYKINFDNVETYLYALQESGSISDIYVKNWREYFKTCQANFELEPQYEGPANGFEYEFIFRSQDYRVQFEKHDEVKVTDVQIDKNKAIATVEFEGGSIYKYELSKSHNDWFIDSIKGEWEN